MDPAFKQYRFNPGMDLEHLVPFDAQAFLDAAKEGATINETEGWVQNLNQSKVQDALNAYQAKLKEAIDAQKPNATVGEVLGIIAADPDKLPYLSGSSPYTIKTLATRMSELPDSLRHHFRYRLFLDDFAYRNDSAAVEYQAPTATLAGKKLTLAWVAATEDDQKAIEALLPKPHPDGSPIQPEELPQGLPASIRLKLEIRVNGETKATGPALTAGSEPIGAGALTNYFDLQNWDETTDLLVTGQQTALGLSVQGVSKTQLETLKTRLEETKAKLEAAQAAPENQRAALLQGLTAEHLTGDMLTANIWSYFAALQGQGFLASTQAALFDRPGLSYGLFHLSPSGVPKGVAQIVGYGLAYGCKGFEADLGWTPAAATIGNRPFYFFNTAGIIFFTDDAALAVTGKTVPLNRLAAVVKSNARRLHTLISDNVPYAANNRLAQLAAAVTTAAILSQMGTAIMTRM